jgi:hypothetical protein
MMKHFAGVTRYLRGAWRGLRLGLALLAAAFLLGGAAVPPGGLPEQVRARTREIAFDFGSWTLDASFAKLSGWALSLERFLAPQTGPALVLETLEQIQRVRQLQAELLQAVSDPAVDDPEATAAPIRQSLSEAHARLDALAPLAESVLQAQLSDILADANLGMMGQTIPPSLFRTTDVPSSLVVSPRERIERTFDVSLNAGLSAEDMAALEDQIFADLDQASLVVPIGGIGTYPTMIMQTTDIVWLTEVIAHEWVHNFLTLRPLGINYATNETLRTINETTASLAGKELGRLILLKYYPDHVPPEPEPAQTDTPTPRPEPVTDPDAFDFRAEMRITRVEVERLLSEGRIVEAEHFMEARRQIFWQNGFPIRKINQAYFAFYGAYNDAPGGGAAGEDTVGPAVVAYRARFEHLSDFLRSIAWVNSFESLMALLTA